MKKKIIIILGVWIALSTLFGIYYKNFRQQYVQANITPINSGAKAAKEPFKTIGMAAAETSLKHNKAILLPFAKQMQKFGAENITLQLERNNRQISKTLPPVIIGSKKHKNKTLCAIVSYDYKDRRYEVGTCK